MFCNITGEEGGMDSISLLGNSSEYDIANVEFRGVRVGGVRVTEAALTHGMKAQFVSNLSFT